MSYGPGWIGTNRQVLYYLSIVGADKDAEGRYLISNGGIFGFLGMWGENTEVVIDSNACYFIDGKPVNLAAGLGETSYGLKITVIA